MAAEQRHRDSVQRAEARRASTITAIAEQERALEEASRDGTAAARARRNRLRVHLAYLHGTLAAVKQELLRLGRQQS